ncbi:MAG: transcriptional regulator [Burkholderiales bacterium]
MPDSDEKIAFSQRLKLALTRSQQEISTPTELALQFNLRHQNEPITPQAAQKWLTGKAMPTADKAQTLAEWLNVPLHWLRYGSPDAKLISPKRQTTSQSETFSPLADDEKELISRMRNLSAHQRKLIIGLIEQLNLGNQLGGNAE